MCITALYSRKSWLTDPATALTHHVIVVALAAGFAALTFSGCSTIKPLVSTDSPTSPTRYSRAPVTKQLESSSFYFQASDGVELAVDLHVPRGLEPNARIPTILHQTRYWRSVDIRFPFNQFVDGRFLLWGSYRRYFVERGYAWIDVDVRGTGASFGTWEHSYARSEVRDGGEMVDWIVQQPWSNGLVGAWGVSYSGGAAEFLLRNQHPAVKAAAPMYSPFDVYDEIGFPGGLRADWYINEWAKGNRTLDANVIPVDSLFAKIAARGVRPVDAEGGRKRLKEALRGRSANLDVSQEAKDIVFRDDASPHMESVDQMSPHAFAEEIDGSHTPIYSYSGWYDGGYQHAAIRRFLTYNNPDDKLIIGPWDHGGAHNASPFAIAGARFDHKGELLKFFDAHLMGIDTGIKEEPKVHYYTMGAERWNSSNEWPPPDTRETRLFFAAENQLTESPVEIGTAAFDEYRVDDALGTGKKSRWTALVGETEDGVLYPDRKEQSSRYLAYTSKPLDAPLEVTGHPIVTIYVSSSARDGAFFVYLEDIAPDGSIRYVTEGSIRALHRNSIDPNPPYRDVVPVRSYRREAAAYLEPGKVAKIEFDLLPTSYRFGRGHSIRVSVAGADVDYFAMPTSEPPIIRVYRGSEGISSILLPIKVEPTEYEAN